jgi:hypothetical protein
MFKSTTILAVRHRERAVLAGDGQVTFGQTVVKQGARKIRRLYNDRILAGFAGSAADSFALFGRFESKLEQYRGNLERSAVELAKDWRSDRILRRLEAMLIVLDKNSTFLLWLGRTLCHGCRESAGRQHRSGRAGDCREVDGNRRRDLHLHEHQDCDRRALTIERECRAHLPAGNNPHIDRGADAAANRRGTR